MAHARDLTAHARAYGNGRAGTTVRRRAHHPARGMSAVSGLKTWGWVALVIGVLQFLAAVSLWRGGLYGRIVGIFAAALGAIAALLSIPAYPFWSLAVFALCVVIIHQIAARGTEGAATAAPAHPVRRATGPR
jgi:hypothetical protein